MTSAPQPRILTALQHALDTELELLEAVPDELWATPVDTAMDGTLGQHFRHCLEHFEPFLDGAVDEVDYDARPRDRRVEGDRSVARRRLQRLRQRADALTEADLDQPLRVRCRVSDHPGPSSEVHSTLGREIMYGISHAVHHHALMAVMCRALGSPVPSELGVAPSTAAYREG